MSDEHAQLVRKLAFIVAELETLGESNMGDLSEHDAGRFHDATDSLRELARELACTNHRDTGRGICAHCGKVL